MQDPVETASYAADANPGPPRHLGVRHDAQRFLPEPGTTVVCHLDASAPAHRAVLAARAAIMALPGAESLIFTPAPSLHMTLFDGVLTTRRSADRWPADQPLDAPIGTVAAAQEARLAGFAPPPPFAVRATGIRPGGLFLDGATAEDAALMRAWRDALTAPLGLRHPDHDSYRFHMTFAYPTAWLSAAQARHWHGALAGILATLQQAAPVIPLNPPAFCVFEDMTHFSERLVLGPPG